MNNASASFFLVFFNLSSSSSVGSRTSTNPYSTRSHNSFEMSRVFTLMLQKSYFSPLKMGSND
ncbi:hypothetical protein Scep_024549 [Stephania cephalantha]|uniref:Secreted protein n=1 Tax=Stephania cephalantha TaxID=152367 RepID=A0AAP0EXF3_9MAGN